MSFIQQVHSLKSFMCHRAQLLFFFIPGTIHGMVQKLCNYDFGKWIRCSIMFDGATYFANAMAFSGDTLKFEFLKQKIYQEALLI